MSTNKSSQQTEINTNQSNVDSTRWYISLKIRGSYLTCEAANKCLNVCEHVEVIETNKDSLFPFRAAL